MIESRTEYNKLFKIFSMKNPDYVMKIMESWMIIDDLEDARKIRYYIDISRTKEKKKFTYRQPFGINLRLRHQVDDQNNQIHETIYLDRTRKTNFWPDCNFAWYLVVS